MINSHLMAGLTRGLSLRLEQAEPTNPEACAAEIIEFEAERQHNEAKTRHHRGRPLPSARWRWRWPLAS